MCVSFDRKTRLTLQLQVNLKNISNPSLSSFRECFIEQLITFSHRCSLTFSTLKFLYKMASVAFNLHFNSSLA